MPRQIRTYGFTPGGKLSILNVSAGIFGSRQTMQYDPLGRLEQENFIEGNLTRVNTFGYDTFDRMRVAKYGVPGSVTGESTTYLFDYDTLGNRLMQTGGGYTTRSTYDGVARLRLTSQITYQTPANGEPYGYVPPSHTIVSNVAATYDLNGNLTQLGNGRYTWNGLGQLTATSGSDAGGAASFTYDVLGRRITRSVATTAPWGSAVPLWDGWTGANPFDRNGALSGLKDVRGSTIGANIWTSTSSSTPARFDFLPYGEAFTNPPGMDISQGEWAGMEMDNARLYYARNRYYSPQMGRFISEDPIGLLGGMNPYMYCDGDPINYTDPIGLLRIGPYDHPWLVFGPDDELDNGTAAPMIAGKSYKCSASCDEMSDGDMMSMRGGRGFRPGMHAGTERSNWAKGATKDLQNELAMSGAGMAVGALRMAATARVEAEAAAAVAGKIRGFWGMTRAGTGRVMRHGQFGKMYKHASSGLWWSADNAGHGGSVWKVFKEEAGGLKWIADADEYGDFIANKHKGATGLSIPWKELSGSNF